MWDAADELQGEDEDGEKKYQCLLFECTNATGDGS
jgi:hypothetical protein